METNPMNPTDNSMPFSHLNGANKPAMVDTTRKPVTTRTAVARAVVTVPARLAEAFDGTELQSPKGPIFQTAIIAGVMGAKKTSELIPFCHPLNIEDCRIAIELNERREVVITAEVSVAARTGVEMEALTAVNVAALTVYDMAKSVAKGIVIRDVRLLSKTGGKETWTADPERRAEA